ncbi:YkgJ family cysteine cluster protein [Ancylothrix sp. C2]|uniref:YkgJ family cysteine cluster protein n=1 Tax=Ancylothrix sp. D3o TaxID=2953691 RepID=UPI0021BBA1BB|nr:YkgJ family cysteine cluster protein [Ancylothrix sp. D3o]MCT7952872.1 YkgJ family cysteine cluster protein [Ancylothrix sp. D3o]
MTNQEIANQVKELYEKIDKQTEKLAQTTGLKCPPGCGRCCENPDIETTPLEMLPIALELFQKKQFQELIEKADTVNWEGRCIFYEPDLFIAGNGRCSIYAFRPSVCRLFGFAAVKNKQGGAELAACRYHKEIMPEMVQKVKESIAGGLPVASFSEIAFQLSNIEPSLGNQRMPINQALKVAIQRVGLMAQWETGER